MAQRDALEDIYKSNNFADLPVMASCSLNSDRLFKALLTLYCFSGIGFLSWTIIEYFMHGAQGIPYFSQLPYVDSSTKLGFVIMVAFHTILTAMSSLGMSAVDGTFAVFTFNIMAFSGLMKNQVKQLNEMLDRKDVPKTSEIIRYKFRNFIMMHKDLTEYSTF